MAVALATPAMEASGRRVQNGLIAASLVATACAVAVAAAGGAPELRLPPDVTYGTAAGSPGPVVFSHATHVAFADTKCTGCHPAIFPILQPTRRITHDAMNAGRQCGACHDGVTASGVQDDCSHCHKMEGGA
jgi:c(7)-type cytochrome triheme protein